MRAPTEKVYSIGQLADYANCKVETIRYYESICLMPEPPRTGGGHRFYTVASLKRLCFVRRSRELGFSIEQIRDLLRLIDEPSHTCGEVKALTLAHDREVLRKIEDLKRLHGALIDLASRSKSKNFTVEDCLIIDALFETRESTS